ncbi:SCO family protein [Virgibacillus indicus]|uniref:SCO family protein n=1 Tax=Virgibacillus indicus TaxID=2024554 RepID=A0A265N804_9BACI|nr:SCO family protein [Virgibacillus indicus]OZU87957.1 SCO family protein [Virgibacillus indicus]
MIKNKHNAVAIIVVLLFGVALFYVGTDGFQAYTAESARTAKLIDEKPSFPEVTLEDSQERMYPFSEFEGKYVMLTFIYTSCTDVCLQLEVNLAEVYDQIPEKYIGEDIVFLSVSFDPTRDTPEVLDKYRSYFESDGETWRMARIPDQQELDSLLDDFGVIVIPDGEGNFVHNSAFYLADREGKLIDVMDYTKIDEAAQKVTSILDAEAGE